MSEMLSWLRSTIEGDKAAAEKATPPPPFLLSEDAEHLMRQNPRDTIARCEAELALLDEHAIEDTGFGKYCRVYAEYSTKRGEESELEPAPAPCRTVQLVARGYRHRLGFQPEWVDG